MAINLNSIQRTKHATPPRILIHGGAKIGKSTFASQAPGAIFLPTEDGLNAINAKALYDAESSKKRLETFEEFDQALQVLEAGNHAFKTIIVDSADWLESLIHQKICTDYGVNSIELAAGGYGKGYIEALNIWRSVINRLDRLNARGWRSTGCSCRQST